MSEWISTKDKLPSLDGLPDYGRSVEVIICTQRGVVLSAYWASNAYAKTEKGRAPRWERGGRILGVSVTHWMPLPEPPEGT